MIFWGLLAGIVIFGLLALAIGLIIFGIVMHSLALVLGESACLAFLVLVFAAGRRE